MVFFNFSTDHGGLGRPVRKSVYLVLLLVLITVTACGERTALKPSSGTAQAEPALARISTFAVNALQDSGLLDPTSKFADYKNIERTSDGTWLVSFESLGCKVSPDTEACDSQGLLTLEVQMDQE
jgi:hypothetical protein